VALVLLTGSCFDSPGQAATRGSSSQGASVWHVHKGQSPPVLGNGAWIHASRVKRERLFQLWGRRNAFRANLVFSRRLPGQRHAARVRSDSTKIELVTHSARLAILEHSSQRRVPLLARTVRAGRPSHPWHPVIAWPATRLLSLAAAGTHPVFLVAKSRFQWVTASQLSYPRMCQDFGLVWRELARMAARPPELPWVEPRIE